MASAAAESLIAIRDNLLAIVQTQTAAWVANGCPPDIGIDGESYQWSAWLTSKLDAIKNLNEQIAAMNPYIVRSRMRG